MSHLDGVTAPAPACPISQELPQENALRHVCASFPFEQPRQGLGRLLVDISLPRKRGRELITPSGDAPGLSLPGTPSRGPSAVQSHAAQRRQPRKPRSHYKPGETLNPS